MLREKILATPKELRSKVRAEEVVKAINLKRPDKLSFKKKRDYEIVEVEQLENGVAVFARVFENGKQIGFGDGTVDIERFIFINPPLLVEDPNGDIVIDDFDIKGVKKGELKYREDPEEALKQSLENAVDTMKSKHDSSRIIEGKRGNTTTVVYSDAGDGIVRASNNTWATLRAASAGSSVNNNSPAYCAWEKEGAFFNGYQPFFMFDTSVIPATDTISAATFKLSLNGDNDRNDSQQLSITNSTQATWNSIDTGDFDQRGGSTEGMTRINCPTGATSGYIDFALNATGLTFIARSGETIPGSASASGKTQLAIRWSSDLDNSTPTARTYMQVRTANAAGTANDPYLTIDHTASSAIKTVNGLVKASVKVINGLAIASVKSWNGLQ